MWVCLGEERPLCLNVILKWFCFGREFGGRQEQLVQALNS